MNDDERLLKQVEQAVNNADSDDTLLNELTLARPKARADFERDLERRLLNQLRARNKGVAPKAKPKRMRRSFVRVLASGLAAALISLLVGIIVLLFRPSAQPTLQIDYFTASATAIYPDECITFSYSADGAKRLFLHISDIYGAPIELQNNPGEIEICPSSMQHHGEQQLVTYTLIVSNGNNQSQSAELNIMMLTPTSTPSVPQPTSTLSVSPTNAVSIPTITLTSTPPAPQPTSTLSVSPTNTTYYIAYFTTDRTEIEAGGCVTLSYHVVGAQQITLQGSNWQGGIETITDNPNQRMICPSAAAGYVPGEPVTYTLNVVYLDEGTDSRSVTITFLTP